MYQECQRGRRRKRDKMESRHSSYNLRESVRGELSVCDLSSPAFWSVKTILCPPPLSFEIDSLYMAQAGLELVTIPLKSPGTEITTAKEHFVQRVFDSIFTQNRFVLESPLLCHLRSMRWSHETVTCHIRFQTFTPTRLKMGCASSNGLSTVENEAMCYLSSFSFNASN